MTVLPRISALVLIVATCTFSADAIAQCDSQSEIPSTECEVLVDIYESTDGDNWENNSNWLNNSPCSWQGVTCADGSVSQLYLAGNNLAGTLPSLSDLENIIRLNFDFNQISGPLPNLSGLTRLEGADFYDNDLSGTLPQLTDLPVLGYLNLGFNNFEGGVPTSIFQLPNLGSLVLDNNPNIQTTITEDKISDSITGLSFDEDAVCAATSTVADWLDSLESNVEYVSCFLVDAQIDGDLLHQGDQLVLLTRLKDQGLDEAIVVDLYLSLLLPDQQTEAFFVLNGSVLDAELSSTDYASWIPIAENFPLEPDLDTGLIPVFVYSLSGIEPEGIYRWIVRATTPNSEAIVFEASDEFYFSPAKQTVSISADTQAQTNAEVSFTANVSNELSGNTYRWEFDDGNQATGNNVSHSFSNADRYRVTLNIENSSIDVATKQYHYINIGRPIGETIFPLQGTAFAPSDTAVIDIPWLDCDQNWNVYIGKYNSLLLEASQDSQVDRQHIVNYLAYADFVFEEYSNIFGWDFLPSVPGLDTYICGAVAGGGTGSGGSFYNFYDFLQPVESILRGDKYGGVLHESIHLWDFRGGTWLNSDDAAHSFTSGMEPIINFLLDIGQGQTGWGGDPRLLTPLSPDYNFNHYYRISLNRYLSHSNLSWSTYYAPPFSEIAYDDEDIPENKEKLLVQGGLLMTLFRMHGESGLRSIFLELEKQALDNPDWFNGQDYLDLSQEQRAETFMKVVADALQLDVSDYFAFWKWPYENLDAYMGRYPVSNKTIDSDGDGYAPLHGDLNDSDPSIFPYAQEILDGKDNNQDGLVDENVYIEGSSDISTIGITLPAGLYGQIESLSDEDIFEFTLSAPADVTITVYSVESDTTVPYASESLRNISTFAGSVYVNDSLYTAIVHEAMSAPESMGVVSLGAGSHTIRVTSATEDERNSNPGEYEIQAFVNDYSITTTADTYINSLYP